MPRTKIIAIGLAVIGVAMIAIGAIAGILPPPLTGIGFLLIAWDYWSRSV